MEEGYTKDKDSIGVELLHYVNSLIEPLANESIGRSAISENTAQNEFNSGGRKSISKLEKESGPETWVVGVDAVDDLRDIIKLIKREIEGGADSERHAITMLSEWNTVNTKLIPLWNISTDNIEIQSLIVQVLFWLTMPPDESWRSFHSKTMKCRAYLKNMQRVKFSLCSTPFWREVIVLYRKLKEVIKSRGFLKEDKDGIRCREEQISHLKEVDNMNSGEEASGEGQGAESNDFLAENDETAENNEMKMERLERLEMIRDLRDEIIAINERAEKRFKQYKSRVGMIKGLLIQALKIQDPTIAESLASFGVRSVHLLLVCCLVRGGVLEIIQDDSRLLSNDQNEEYVMWDSEATAPWRILEYVYGLICNIQPIDFVNELFGLKSKLSETEIFKNSLIEKMKSIKRSSSSGFTSNSLMNRHSRFNPELARRRIKENNGGTTSQVANSKRVSMQRVSKYRHDFDVDEIYEYIDIFIGAMQSTGGSIHCLEMYGYPTIEGAMGSIDGVESQCYSDVIQTMGEFLDNFFNLEFPKLLEKIFTILRGGGDKHTVWDVSRLISLMTWVLAYKRSVFFEVTKSEKDEEVIKGELTRLLMETRYLLDTKENMAIDFIYSTIKLHARERLLKNKSHKVARVAIRCLNEQLKIIHLVANSEDEAIRGLGTSLIAFIIRLDVMNCLAWILKHYTKTSHHPELFLYSIETSNRLIKLFTKLGGETLVSTRRRRRDRPMEMKDYNEEEEECEYEERQTGFNESYYSEKVKMMSLDEMMGDFCDGRVVSNLMLLVQNYSTNHSNINWHTARLARKIITTRPPGEVSKVGEDGREEPFKQLFCGLFFQLSYFITFSQILSDKSFLSHSSTDKGAQDIVLLSRHVIHTFWEVARINQFVFVELLFSKNSARGLGLADPERLRSIFTDYEEGVDAAIVTRMDVTGEEDVFEARSFVKNQMNKEKQAASNWSKEDDEELLALYAQYEGNPKCISIIASLMSDMKTERSVKKRLRDLGKLGSDEGRMDQDECDGDAAQVAINADLVSGMVGFSNMHSEERTDEGVGFDPSVVLKELLGILEESLSTREIFGDGQFGEIPVEFPSSLPTSLLTDPNYRLILSSMGLKEPKAEDGLWMVPKGLSVEKYEESISLFREYMDKDVFELAEMLGQIQGEGSSSSETGSQNWRFSAKALKSTIQDFMEDSGLSGGISQVLDADFPVDNGLLHLISSELKVVLDKNSHGDSWQRTEQEDLYFCLSQARLDGLGVRADFGRVYESQTMSKLLHLLGFKKSTVSSDVDFMVHLDRGVSKESLGSSEPRGDRMYSLFDEEDGGDDVGGPSGQSSARGWVLDYERLSLGEFRQRSKLFCDLVMETADISARIGKELKRVDTFSKKMISQICRGVYDLRRSCRDSRFLRMLISKLDGYLQSSGEGGDPDFVIGAYGSEDSSGVEDQYVGQIMESLMGQRDDESGGWSIRRFIEGYTFDRIRELRELLSRLDDLEIPELRQFTESVTGKKLKVSKERVRSVSRSSSKRTARRVDDENAVKEDSDDGDDSMEQSMGADILDGAIPYMIDEGDDRWRKDWERLEREMRNVGSESLFEDEEERHVRADLIPDELFGDSE
ncbi:SANT domain containing protein [Cryptosporidium canis]|uniref:SANT domain containing protein n=1 Tax=Cryptosporidium canis TaxID=195482 RepID=A0ABQ8P6G1_9CRYT|nr:SANT domain containing protein [Cryptosporidium canis]